ncbi:MAG: hypothetical protein ACN6O6_23745 [Pseudomonas sp.]
MNRFAAVASLIAASAFASRVPAADTNKVAEKTRKVPAGHSHK